MSLDLVSITEALEDGIQSLSSEISLVAGAILPSEVQLFAQTSLVGSGASLTSVGVGAAILVSLLQ